MQKYKKSFTVDHKRYWVYGNTKKEIKEKEWKKREQITRAKEEKANPTLNNYFKKYLSEVEKTVKESTAYSASTIYNRAAQVELENEIPLGEMKLRDIRRCDIEFVRNQLMKDLSPSYVNSIIGRLSTIFKNAIYDDYLDRNPCRGVKDVRNNTTVHETKHRGLTEEETRLFFNEAKKRKSYYYNLFAFMIKTGARLGEATALYPTDIDLEDNLIHIRRTVTRNWTGSAVVGNDTKTQKSMRGIPLTADIVAILKNQISINISIFGDDAKNGLIFRGINGGLLSGVIANEEIKKICEEINIPYFTCHAFRNTFATRFMEQRPQDYEILSDILGHTSVAMTLDFYTHVMKDRKIKSMNDIEINIE